MRILAIAALAGWRAGMLWAPDDGVVVEAAPGGAPPGGDPAPAGDAPPAWLANLDDETREAISHKGYKSEQDLAKGYLEAQRFINADGKKLLVPGEDAEPAAWEKFYGELGRPETAEAYEYFTPEGVEIPEDLQQFRTAMAGAAHKAGLNQAQLTGIEGSYNEFLNGRQEAFVEAGERELADLKIEWGDDHPANEALAKSAFAALAPGDEDLGELERLVGSARMLKMFQKAGTMLGGRVGTVDGGQDPLGMGDPMKNPAAAKIEIAKVYDAADKDQKHPYVNKQHPDHKATAARLQQLHSVAYPGN